MALNVIADVRKLSESNIVKYMASVHHTVIIKQMWDYKCSYRKARRTS